MNPFTTQSPSRGSPYDSDSSDDEIVVNTKSLRSTNAENTNPNKSRLREKCWNSRKDRLARTSTSGSVDSSDSRLAQMTETQCDPEDMLLTQHGGVEECTKEEKEEEKEKAEDFDESAFLPDDISQPESVEPVDEASVESVSEPVPEPVPEPVAEPTPQPVDVPAEAAEPTPQPTPGAAADATVEPVLEPTPQPTPEAVANPPPAPLANDYSSSEDLPVYSEAEFQLAVEAKLAKAVKEAKAEAEAEAAKAMKQAKVEMDKQMEDVIALQEQGEIGRRSSQPSTQKTLTQPRRSSLRRSWQNSRRRRRSSRQRSLLRIRRSRASAPSKMSFSRR